MDDQRFDNLSRIIARSTTRRATVKGIAAAIGGGVFASVFGVRAQRASAAGGSVPPGGGCNDDSDCAEGTCSSTDGRNGVCFCVDPDQPVIGCSCNTGDADPCGGSPICCPSSDLPDSVGVCVPASEGCNPTGDCAIAGDACGEGTDCCDNLICDSGTCIDNCQEPGGLCEFDENCCIGTCMGGTCACLTASEPWLGCDCNVGTEAPCGGGTVICCPTGGGEGAPGVCTDESVGCESVCSVYPGDACESNTDCCAGSCVEGVCSCSPGPGWIGCDCATDYEGACGGGESSICCPTGSTDIGVCTAIGDGCPVICTSDPGDECGSDGDCCLGTCMSGVCACNDPSRPIIGCPCEVGDEGACGGLSDLCCNIGQEPGSAGSCISPMVGTCNPTGNCIADPGETCMADADCCEGKCSNDGVCYCADPAEPLRGCSCHTGTLDPCGADSLLCCATTTTPGGPGICTPDRLGCEPVGTCTDKGGHCHHDDECCDMLCCVDGGVCGTPPPPPKPVKPAETVTTLPATGSGSNDGSNLGAWIGVTAAAGAAAVIAGRKLNPKPAEGSDES